MNFHFGISPCPNDTFMFYRFLLDYPNVQTSFLDIEQLNRGLLEKKFDLAKCSISLYPQISSDYAILPTGMAVGFGNGPLLISKIKDLELNDSTLVAIPGRNTTAFALLRKYFPQLQNFKEVVFSSIPSLVAKDLVDAGLIIHESRFTYDKLSLKKLFDLGDLWEKETNLPLPLGIVVMKRKWIADFAVRWTEKIRTSILYAWEHFDEVLLFCRQHASEIEDEVMKKHIQLYVNEYSLDPGIEGRLAVEHFLAMFHKENVFLSDIWAI
ncbi:MAG: 1,4-dihydroxy-6-naphthoate synthase [Bacteroidales bacterium]|nr:1,4-dihydroxy-6-naphthoate synthase [Bacteroidales bacterium]